MDRNQSLINSNYSVDASHRPLVKKPTKNRVQRTIGKSRSSRAPLRTRLQLEIRIHAKTNPLKNRTQTRDTCRPKDSNNDRDDRSGGSGGCFTVPVPVAKVEC